MMTGVLAAMDWVALASVATAAATLVLAIATFLSVRTGNRTAAAAEQSLNAQLWPLLAPARFDDPDQKVMFQDQHKVVVAGGLGAIDVTTENIYFAIPVRNVGPGLAVLDRWSFTAGRVTGNEPLGDVATFRRLTRDIYIAPGDVGFWQGTIRDVADPQFAEAAATARDHDYMTIDLLYSDHLGSQHTVSRFVMTPVSEGRWLAGVARHFSLDRPDPR
jgi:hypothetical protein